MSHRYMLWAGHVFVLLLLGEGIRWLVGNIRGMPEFNLLLVLAAMTGLVLNHFRWWNLGRKISDNATLAKIDGLVLANYCILVFVLELSSFR